MIDVTKLYNIRTEYTAGLWWIDFIKAWSLISTSYFEECTLKDLTEKLKKRRNKYIKRGRKTKFVS